VDFTIALLGASFLLSLVALLVFIASLSKGLLRTSKRDAEVIFGDDEVGLAEDPAAGAGAGRLQASIESASGAMPHAAMSDELLLERREIDRSSVRVVWLALTLAMFWLVFGSFAGLTSALKMHWPDWLTQWAALGFGRLRPLHLNVINYGWASLAGVGIAFWMLPRLLRTPLRGEYFAIAGVLLWSFGVFCGAVALLAGYSAGLEWLEFPFPIPLLLVIAGGLMAVPLLKTLAARKVHHLYVSVWYMGAALFWFPVLYLVANVPGVHFGVQQAAMNWWFGHNVLGLWFTPLGLAAAYYFIPKVLGRPIYSYNLSLLGFWTLAFFYSQVGGHHLIGGPLPSWLITLSIVQSVMMAVPVITVAINQHMTVVGRFDALRHSPTLRFVVLGAMLYTLTSLQGSMEALRSINAVTHFTHYTVAHAHLGMYGFFTMIMFGAIYFVMPRVTEYEWPYPRLITAHFWLSSIGIGIYFVSLTIGGWLQGKAMLDAERPFMDSVLLTIPYLYGRSIGGTLMTLGHLIFAVHFSIVALRLGPKRVGAVQLAEREALANAQ
jgi:cytochrome c oxidase cbb3-type subunit 1